MYVNTDIKSNKKLQEVRVQTKIYIYDILSENIEFTSQNIYIWLAKQIWTLVSKKKCQDPSVYLKPNVRSITTMSYLGLDEFNYLSLITIMSCFNIVCRSNISHS